MSKTEIVTELQTILNDLKGITADLEQNISGLKDFLEDRKFIPKELGASIREQLEAIDAKQTEIVSKYEMLDVQKPEMQHTAIEENLSEIQKVIEENEKYRKAIAFFLELHVTDGEDLVHDHNFAVQMGGNGECQFHEHAAGIALDRRVDKVANLGELNNFRHLGVNFGAGHT